MNHCRTSNTPGEAQSIFASPDARRSRSPSALHRPRKFLDKKIAEDFDALRPRPSGRRHPVHGAKWERPIRQQSLEPTGGEGLAQNEFGQNAEPGSGDQGRHHRVAIVDAQWTRWPHGGGLTVFGKAPSLGRRRIAVANAAVLREVEWMSRSAMFVQVGR